MSLIRTIKQSFDLIKAYDLSLLLTIFFIFTHFQHIIRNQPVLFIPLIGLTSIGILFQDSRQSKWLWGPLTGIYWVWIILYWQVIDNHVFLWGYWMLSIYISLWMPSPKRALQLSATGLIGGCMALSVIQKLNPTYLSGDFFYFTLLTDSRFFFMDMFFKEDVIAIINENIQSISEMMSHSKAMVLNPGPALFRPIAYVLSGYVLLLEAFIATMFFMPRRWAYQWQHWGLFLFFSIYVILPIQGFAYALITMGIALVKPHDKKLTFAYFAVLLYMICVSDVTIDYLMRVLR
jgi:hypothetical protein